MKIPGLKYFKMLSVGRLFIKGKEVTNAFDLSGLIRVGTITLNGTNPTKVAFQGDVVAAHKGATDGPFDFSAGSKTLKITPGGESEETITFTATAGKHTGGTGGLGDLTDFVDNKFLISVDDEEYEEVELTLGSCDTGANTATEMETAIQALGGVYGSVTVAFTQDAAGPPQTGSYVITSGTVGKGSKVRIKAAPLGNVTEELDIGEGVGTNVDGGGVGLNSEEATATEVAAFITEEATNFIAEADGENVVILGKVPGGSLAIGSSSADAILGLTVGTYYGAVGLGYDSDMADDEYFVVPVPVGIASASTVKPLSISNKATDGFDVVAGDASATFDVDLLILGTPEG